MTAFLCFLLLLAAHHGLVMFNGFPVPGATVTVTQDQRQYVAITNPQGCYSFSELGEAPFTIEVAMPGFFTIRRITGSPTAEFEMKMLPIEEIHSDSPGFAEAAAVEALLTTTQPTDRFDSAAFQRMEVHAVDTKPAQATNDTPSKFSPFALLSPEDLNRRAADGFLISGSLNNAAASTFAQPARIGNYIRSKRLYTGNAGVTVDSSRLNARSYSLTGQNTPEPSYNRFTGSFNIGGPLRIPFLKTNPNNSPTFFFGYERIQNRTAETRTGRMPAAAERDGDFSQTLDPFGQPVRIIDPVAGLDFTGSLIPRDRISPQATALLKLFPLPNFSENAPYNYQISAAKNQHQDTIEGRLGKSLNPRNQLSGNVDVKSMRSDSLNLFQFLDTSHLSGINAVVQWTTTPTRRFSSVVRYQYNRQSTRSTPHFAYRMNVSGVAGINGNNQEPPNWGPPALNFSGGTSTLSDGQYSFNRSQNSIVSFSSYWLPGRHSLTFGADIRRCQYNMLSQMDPRGAFSFTGSQTGYDFADFLLGIPDTSSIAFGNADKYFRQSFYDGFIMDDYRVNSALTIHAGIRWEYETPIGELRGRLVNLEIARDFGSITQVAGNGLLQPDRFGIQPRVAFAWRPFAASSTVVRGGYGIYRNTNVYPSIAMQMAQQPPFSKSLSFQNSESNPLSLANGFVSPPGLTTNTFAVDPHFRVGYLQSWQLSVQRDLPAILQMTFMYLGSKGTRLQQASLPNTFPSGAISPSGYIYLSSNGNSIRHAAQFQLRRRPRNGFAASLQYTYSKTFDDAPMMAGDVGTANQGAAIAQNWLDFRAERAPSNFDQRHHISLQMQYTTGMGIGGGALMAGWKGALFKEWTSALQLTVGSGFPLTPLYYAAVKGTGITGNLRPDVTGEPVMDAPPGLFLNPAAFRTPADGRWGNAGRNSITGPSQFSFDASLGRSFLYRDQYIVDFRVDVTNLLNHVTVKSWNTTINNAQFGLASRVGPMRSIQTTLRFRF